MNLLADADDSQPRTNRQDDTQGAYARFAGLMYLLVLILDVAGAVIISNVVGSGSFIEMSHRVIASQQLYRIGLCVSLVGSLATILLATALYVAVRPVDRSLALMALLFRVIEAATGSIGIIGGFAVLKIHLAANHANAFDENQLDALAQLMSGVTTEVSAIFFCVGSTISFYLLLRSGYIPKLLPAWGIFASLVYLGLWFGSLALPHVEAQAMVYGSLPILVAELSTAFWLLIKGIRIRASTLPSAGHRPQNA